MVYAVIMLLCLGARALVGSAGDCLRANLVDHVCYLASDSLGGRAPISKGDSLARAYIASYFAACGLCPIMEDGGFFQGVPVLTSIAADSSSAVIVQHAGRTTRLGRPAEFEIDSESGSGEVDGEVAFIGYGFHAPEEGIDDYATLPLRGKIVMCYLYPPRHLDIGIRKLSWNVPFRKKIELIRERGGSAVVFVCANGLSMRDGARPQGRDKSPPQHLHPQDIPIVRISESTMVKVMENAGVNIAALKESMAQPRVFEPFDIPNVRISMETRLTYLYKETYNVMGFLRGKDSTQTVIIGGHYDHVGPVNGVVRPGADDNASGVSVVLELARLCASRNTQGCNLLFVAFGAEERGNIGSEFFINHVPEGVGRIKAMLNFDMVGRPRENVVNVHHVQSAKEWETVLGTIPAEQLDIRSGPNWSATDSGPFYRAGIPVLWFYTGAHEDEASGERVDSIDFTGMEKIVRYSLNLIERIGSSSVLLTFAESANTP